MAVTPILFVNISTDDGAVPIMSHQLATLTEGELKHLHISREQLRWVFDEGERLKKGAREYTSGRSSSPVCL